MDAGEIALVGAVAGVVASIVGAGGALAAARWTGRYQSLSQHAHWRRQVRRDAYAAFLDSVAQINELRRTHRERTLLGHEMPTGTADRLRELICNIEKALLVVELEGPAQAAADADRVMRSIAGWQASVIVAELRAVRGLPPHDDVPTSDALDRQVNSAVTSFKATARAALDVPDRLSHGEGL
ncbi:hypothetical protein [Streptomyces sp. NPDC055109]